MKYILITLALLLSFSFAQATEAPQTEDKMVAVILMMDDGDDQEIVATVYTSLMAAEKVSKVLDIEMVAQSEVSDDVFIFSLKSEEQKDLTLRMLDEEGYSTHANRQLRVENGNNYNALNVESLPDGTYRFILTDENGAEKTQSVTITRDK